MGTGTATFRTPLSVAAVGGRSSRELREVVAYVADVTRGSVVVRSARHADIQLEIVAPEAPRLPGDEAYELRVSGDGIRLLARTSAGLVRGTQTLRQMLPPSGSGNQPRRVTLPVVTIEDAPRFAWRGAMLDVGRHFLTVSEVERFIDLLALHKMNVLHWHLTEDQGWRLASARYPRLTEVGSWRTEVDGTRHGGFYTREEVQRVVAYAARRHITVVPEIEMPGHATAALVAYPEFGCVPAPARVPATWGVFPDVFCPGKEETFTFLQAILDEVLALFPSKVIHIGGDEVPKDHWKACPRCQARIKAEGLKDEAALQSYFIRRIAGYLAGRGRELAGWDEILEGGLPPGVTVQVWRDMEHLRSAVGQGSRVIASPTSHAYINRSPLELPLRTVFAFDPVPPGLSTEQASLVLGGEVTLWSEHIDAANLDQMAFPRLSAMAEVLWSGPRGDYDHFKARLDRGLLPRLRAMGVRPGPESQALLSLTPFVDPSGARAGVRVAGAVEGLSVRFTTDGTRPTLTSPMLTADTRFSDTGVVQIQPFIDGRPTLDRRTLTIERHAAVGSTVKPVPAPSPAYSGTGPVTLTDGIRGSLDFHDGLWQGWQGTDVEVTIDLGESRAVKAIEVGALQVMRSWILLPRAVSCTLSADGTTWDTLGEVTHDVPLQREGPEVHAFRCASLAEKQARYLRVHAKNAGPLPAWHTGAGGASWIFLDEIVVR
jgi:hexosaminidase